jgi:hypothetical protein
MNSIRNFPREMFLWGGGEAILKGLTAPERKLSEEEIAWMVADFVVKADRDSVAWTEKAMEELPVPEINYIADTLIEDTIILDSFSKDLPPHETDDGAGYLHTYLQGEGQRWGVVPGSEDYENLLKKFRKAQVEIANHSIDRLHGRRPIKRDFREFSEHTILPAAANSRSTRRDSIFTLVRASFRIFVLRETLSSVFLMMGRSCAGTFARR